MTSLEQESRMVIDDLKIGVLIPTFNNANTLQSVIKGCLHLPITLSWLMTEVRMKRALY
jgi:hypothetical protein